MEAFLVDKFGEAESPGLDDVGMRRIDFELYFLIFVEFQAYLFGKYFFLYKISKYLFVIDDLKLNIEVEFDGSEGLNVWMLWVGNEESLIDESQ